MNKSIIIGIVAVIILSAGGYFVLTQGSDKSKTVSNTSTESSPTLEGKVPSKTITYTDNGFSPSTITIKARSALIIKNDSSSDMEFSSDPHPVHTDDPELNKSVLAPGESKLIFPNVKGTHGYHNHLNSTHTGTLIVQ